MYPSAHRLRRLHGGLYDLVMMSRACYTKRSKLMHELMSQLARFRPTRISEKAKGLAIEVSVVAAGRQEGSIKTKVKIFSLDRAPRYQIRMFR